MISGHTLRGRESIYDAIMHAYHGACAGPVTNLGYLPFGDRSNSSETCLCRMLDVPGYFRSRRALLPRMGKAGGLRKTCPLGTLPDDPQLDGCVQPEATGSNQRDFRALGYRVHRVCAWIGIELNESKPIWSLIQGTL